MTAPSELAQSIDAWASDNDVTIFSTEDVYNALDFIDNRKDVSEALRYMFKKGMVGRDRKDAKGFWYALADVAPSHFEFYNLNPVGYVSVLDVTIDEDNPVPISDVSEYIDNMIKIETVTTGYDKVEENISSGCADQQADVSTHNGIDIVKDTMYRGVSFDIDLAMLEERNTEPADSIQINGDHYKKLTIEHCNALKELIGNEQFTGFLKCNAIVHLAMCDEKNGIEDLKKARHYLDKLIEVSERGE